MITKLYIQNYAIIESLDINFSKGLTIITGETGAGKSILLGALSLIMGDRADKSVFFDKSIKVVVEASFDVKEYHLQAFFDREELDYDDEVLIRREVSPSGKSRAFVNDTPVRLTLLRKLTAVLIDVHRQFDSLDINDVSFQLRMVDALANNKTLLTDYSSDYAAFRLAKKQYEKLLEMDLSARKEMDFLTFQETELREADLEPNEDVELEAAIKKMEQADQTQNLLSGILHRMDDQDQGAIATLQTASAELHKSGKNVTDYGSLAEKLDAILLDLQALRDEMAQVVDDAELDPALLAEYSSRLDVLFRLQKKHNVLDVNGLIDIQKAMQLQLSEYGDLTNQISEAAATIKRLDGALRKKAQEISKKRQAVVPKFQSVVSQKLASLGMGHARFVVSIEQKDELEATGFDEVAFLFSANKGSELLPVRKVASGGEMSRLALVTKSLVASSIPLPTIIFDEIDAGVSGDVALKMGQILQELAEEHQVVVVTHSPQVASKAERHYFVYKKDDTDRTITKVKELTKEEQVRSIAVMLSQNPPSYSAIENAKELIGMP